MPYWLSSRLTRRGGLVLLLASSLLAAPTADAPAEARVRELPLPSHHLAHGFRNLDPSYDYTLLGRTWSLLRRSVHREAPRGAPPAPVANDGVALRANGTHPTVTWIGHATLLVQLDGLNILTDPNWSDHAGPLPFGTRRLVPPGVRFKDLPHIDAVIISHDHYDHLDLPTVERLAREHHPTFFVPLGLRDWLAERGIHDVVELDWWDSQTFRGLRFTATPAQHGSGRGLLDQNLRLWCSWVIADARGKRLFFAGDTGYTPRLTEIGRRLGPFDVAAIPIGGYSAFAGQHPNHVNPEEAMQLFDDLGGRIFVPMHWGTFALNREPFREPPDRLLAEALRRGEEERIALLSQGQSISW
ncbi:MAG: MBL fold metallo-hydrolase [Candidatus Rokuibacteriota bacterium]|nr:MAG: MBL fold metallo-hydrolase [Candidatus Rokubacteria bacterium]